jgi:hypothetical protein
VVWDMAWSQKQDVQVVRRGVQPPPTETAQLAQDVRVDVRVDDSQPATPA